MTVVLPRLCLLSTHSGVLVSGHGPNIEWIEGGKICGRLRVFNQEGSHVFGLVSCLSNDALFVYGEKSIAYCSSHVQNGVLDKNYTKKFHDTILALKVLTNNQIAILFMSNLCALYGYEIVEGDLKLIRTQSVQSDHVATMLNGLLLGDTWEDLVVISGTVFGEILYSEPHTGSSVSRKFLGHTGMIFGLLAHGSSLFSISDDRSVRVWPLEAKSTDCESVDEIDSVFGHSARPFAICSSPDNFIYSAGVDQLVCKWQLNQEHKLVLVDQLELNTGGIRSLIYFENSLWVGSETGALVQLAFASICSNAAVPKALKSCEDLRGFGYLGNALFTVDGKGQLYKDGEAKYVGKCLRYISTSPSYCSEELLVAFERNACAIFTHQKEILLEFEGDVLNAICSDVHVFVYKINKRGALYSSSGVLLREFDVSKSLASLSKKVSFLPSAFGLFRSTNGEEHILLGSTCGHIVHCCLEEHENVLNSVPEISRMCAKGQVMNIRVLGDRIAIYCKNGTLTCWTFAAESKFLPSALPLIHGSSSLDWPCSSYFIDNREYVAEFHSTQFRLLDRNTGLAVLDFFCGGGNRPWSFRLHKCQVNGTILGTLSFIRKETLLEVTAGIHSINYVSDCLHVSQIVSIANISSIDDSSCIVCTSGVDCQVTFSELNSATQEVKALDKVATTDGITSVCLLESTKLSQDEITLILGSTKGCISSWLVKLDGSVLKDLIVTGSYEHPDGTRVLDIMTKKVDPTFHECVAVLADGSIILLTLNVTSDGIAFALCSTIEPPDYSLYTKGQLLNDDFFWISTSGKLGQHKIMNNNTFSFVKQIQAVKCGISSIAVAASLKSNEYVCVIGDESGSLNVYKVNDEKFENICTVSYHSATVTDVKIHVENNTVLIHSVSLDCRAVVHRIDLTLRKVTLFKGKCLSIWDPARFMLFGTSLIAVGSGLEVISM